MLCCNAKKTQARNAFLLFLAYICIFSHCNEVRDGEVQKCRVGYNDVLNCHGNRGYSPVLLLGHSVNHSACELYFATPNCTTSIPVAQWSRFRFAIVTHELRLQSTLQWVRHMAQLGSDKHSCICTEAWHNIGLYTAVKVKTQTNKNISKSAEDKTNCPAAMLQNIQ